MPRVEARDSNRSISPSGKRTQRAQGQFTWSELCVGVSGGRSLEIYPFDRLRLRRSRERKGRSLNDRGDDVAARIQEAPRGPPCTWTDGLQACTLRLLSGLCRCAVHGGMTRWGFFRRASSSSELAQLPGCPIAEWSNCSDVCRIARKIRIDPCESRRRWRRWDTGRCTPCWPQS